MTYPEQPLDPIPIVGVFLLVVVVLLGLFEGGFRIGRWWKARTPNVARSAEITEELWTMAEQVANEQPTSVAIGLYVESLNETIDLDAKRTTAIVYARVPETVLDLLIVGAAVTPGMVGYSAGLAGRRSLFSAVVLVVVLSSVLTLVIDLDRTRNGFIHVSQEPMLDLMEELGPP